MIYDHVFLFFKICVSFIGPNVMGNRKTTYSVCLSTGSLTLKPSVLP